MRKFSLISTLLLCFPASSAVEAASPAQVIQGAGHWGVGLGGGTATSGLSGKLFVSDHSALQLVIGSAGYNHHKDFGDSALGLDLDWLHEGAPLFHEDLVLDVGWAIGFGGWAWVGEPFWLGGNGVLSLQFEFIPVPVDFVLEYRPAVRVWDDFAVEFGNFGGHVRFYFQ
jgi:hypothetical protein